MDYRRHRPTKLNYLLIKLIKAHHPIQPSCPSCILLFFPLSSKDKMMEDGSQRTIAVQFGIFHIAKLQKWSSIWKRMLYFLCALFHRYRDIKSNWCLVVVGNQSWGTKKIRAEILRRLLAVQIWISCCSSCSLCCASSGGDFYPGVAPTHARRHVARTI